MPVAVVASDIFVSLLKFMNKFEIKIGQIFYARVFFVSSCCICKLIMFTSYINTYLHDETFSVPYLPPGSLVKRR